MDRWFFDSDSGGNQKKVQLFCFPFAGGGVSSFKKWNVHLNDYIRLRVLALPGREMRFSEPPVKDMNYLIGELTSYLIDKVEPPYFFFGHSMGAIIAFELVHQLISRGMQPPAALVVSARGSELEVRGGLSALKELEAEQLEKLSSSFDSTINKTLISQLKKLTTASLENDVALCSTLDLNDNKVLDIPIYGLYGTHDRYASSSNMLNWQTKTTASFVLNEIVGDHFFMMDNAEDTCKFINSIIEDSLK